MLDDQARLAILTEINADAGADEALRAVAGLAAQFCGTPMAAVSLVGEHEQRFVGSSGLDVDHTDRASSFCAVAMETPSVPLLVPDTHVDGRFAGNALVTGAPHIRAYAGVPLLAVEQVPLGAVCVLSDRSQALTSQQLAALQALATITERLLHSQRTTTRLQSTVTQLNAAVQAQQASQAQLRTAFDHVTVAMTLVDERGMYVRVNQAFAELLGYTVEEVTGRSFREFTEASDLDAEVSAIGEVISGSRRTALREKRYRHRDGTLIPALVSSSLVQPVPEETWQVLSSIESLAQRRAAEAGLLELHSAVDGILTIDEHSRVVAWNLGAQNMLGYLAAEMIGQPLERIIPVHVQAAHQARVALAVAGDPAAQLGAPVEVVVVHADGHELLAELSLSAWFEHGRPRFTAILRDITAQRRTEQATTLVRHAATTANSADSFAAAAREIVREVCERLQWRAGHAWIRDGATAVWHVNDHAGADGVPHRRVSDETISSAGTPLCALGMLAAAGTIPKAEDLPFDTAVRMAAGPQDLAPMGAAVPQCGIGAALAVPILAGGEAAGTLAFYLPTGTPLPHTEIIDALQQVGLALGRMVERQRTRERLAWQATHDPLTDLANRRLLLQQISATQRDTTLHPHRRSAVLLLNLDRFRLINDSLGYAAGDELLHQVADRLHAAVREGDVVARLSADEFVVLTHDTTTPATTDTDTYQGSAAASTAVAHRLLQAIGEPVSIAGNRLQLRASIGVAPITTQHAAADHDPAAVLRDADAALRHAKRLGKNQVTVFDRSLAQRTEQRLDDETALAYAIVSDQLLLHYQPIIALDTGRVTGAEALVRWQRPSHGMIAPDQFIALAEDSGLIVDLGRWVLRQACRDAARWPDTVPAMTHASISVNVSARQLIHPTFLTDLDQALADTRLDPQRLILEITETALIDETDNVLHVLHAVRARGVQLALDDFGTGYSSLSYVQQLPATILKIDKSFVDPITGPGNGDALSEVVIKLAAATGLRTVAEGVETPEQAAALRQLGCHRGQGYTWSRPVPQHQLSAAIAQLTAAQQGSHGAPLAV